MKIKVYNDDNEEVFHGEAEQFLADNDYDEEVSAMVDNAIQNGKSNHFFYPSGLWKVTLVQKEN